MFKGCKFSGNLLEYIARLYSSIHFARQYHPFSTQNKYYLFHALYCDARKLSFENCNYEIKYVDIVKVIMGEYGSD